MVSYVIGVRNMENTIGKNIESIINQDYPNKEIIVINDGSDDNTEKILKKYPIMFINTEKIGISNARNLGYKKSHGEYVAFTDADCELDRLWTKKMLECFDGKKVGLVGGKTIFKTDESFTSIYRNIEFNRRQKNIKGQEVVWAGGPGSMFWRKVLDEIGGFNPNWIHGEDAEISFLTVKHGYRIIRQNDAITYHVPENSFKKLVKKGLRDAKAYVRVSKSHITTSLRNKFNTTWYFPYDMVLLPVLYAFLIISGIFLPIVYILNSFIFMLSLLGIILIIWLAVVIFIGLFLFIYGLIPSFEAAKHSKFKRIKAFIGTFFLHHGRGFAWGIGLLIGIINIISKKK